MHDEFAWHSKILTFGLVISLFVDINEMAKAFENF